MKNIKYLLVVLTWVSAVCAQTSPEKQKFISETLNQTKLGKEELLIKFTNFDFNSLWMENDSAIIGFIGDNYQRLNIKFLAIIKNNENPNKYYLYGKSMVNYNVCQFLGEIEIVHIRKVKDIEKQQLYEEAKRQNDEEAVKRFSKQEYVLLAKCQFFEDPNQKGSGIFEGIIKTCFYIDSCKIVYNDLAIESDNFSNNQFVGTWTSYVSGVSKRCNWGEFRIPYSGDLDIGTGEFSPNIKYLDKGWDTYYKSFILNDANAKQREQLIWW